MREEGGYAAWLVVLTREWSAPNANGIRSSQRSLRNLMYFFTDYVSHALRVGQGLLLSANIGNTFIIHSSRKNCEHVSCSPSPARHVTDSCLVDIALLCHWLDIQQWLEYFGLATLMFSVFQLTHSVSWQSLNMLVKLFNASSQILQVNPFC